MDLSAAAAKYVFVAILWRSFLFYCGHKMVLSASTPGETAPAGLA